MKIEDLKKKREKLDARIKALTAKIAAAERAEREREQREILKMLRSRGITAAQLAQILEREKSAPPAQSETSE